jgi:hypothetical protein
MAGLSNPAVDRWAEWRCGQGPGRRLKAVSVTFGTDQVIVMF